MIGRKKLPFWYRSSTLPKIMETELFIKRLPEQIKTLIGHEARLHRRSVNQEAIVLLEEALANRAVSAQRQRHEVHDILARYAAATRGNRRPAEDIIEYDDSGLPK